MPEFPYPGGGTCCSPRCVPEWAELPVQQVRPDLLCEYCAEGVRAGTAAHLLSQCSKSLPPAPRKGPHVRHKLPVCHLYPCCSNNAQNQSRSPTQAPMGENLLFPSTSSLHCCAPTLISVSPCSRLFPSPCSPPWTSIHGQFLYTCMIEYQKKFKNLNLAVCTNTFQSSCRSPGKDFSKECRPCSFPFLFFSLSLCSEVTVRRGGREGLTAEQEI